MKNKTRIIVITVTDENGNVLDTETVIYPANTMAIAYRPLCKGVRSVETEDVLIIGKK
jgi:hypothetical protein